MTDTRQRMGEWTRDGDEPDRANPLPPRNADYEALFALTSTPTIEIDGAGSVVAANRAAGRLFHRDPGRLVDERVDDVFGAAVAARLGARGPIDVVAALPDGPTALRLFTVARELAAGGDTHVVVQAIHREGRTPDADRTAHSGRMTLIDDISHNLGTPLAIVSGYAETLAERWGELGATEVEAATRAIRRHAQRAVEELRDVQARVRAVDGGTGTVPTNMLVAWLRRMLAAPLATTGGSLAVGDVPTQVTVDAGVARQALLSICQAFLGAEQPATDIRIDASTIAGGTTFTITARGLGALRDDHREMLAVTARVVADAGGSHESDDDGSVHRVTLPPNAWSSREPARISVALIEDDPDAAALVHASLRSQSSVFEVVADERTLAGGLAAVAETQPRILLLDNHLPDGHGSASVDRIRELSPRTTIVVLSSRGPVGPREESTVGVHWLEKGRVLADLGAQLLAVMADG